MRSVRSQSELYLYKRFMRINVARVTCESILSADLCELAGPISQYHRATFVVQAGIKGAVRVIHASAHKPSPGDLVVGRGVQAECPLESCHGVGRTGDGRAGGQRRLVLRPPDELAAHDK